MSKTAAFESVDDVLRFHAVPASGPEFHLRMRSGRVLSYRPHVSLMSWQDTGLPVDLGRVGRSYEAKEFRQTLATSPQKPVGKSRRLRKLKVSLGFKCNYSCSYCSQAAHRLKEPPMTETRIQNFLRQISAVIDNPEGEGLKIEMWGGEPLAYWNVFRQLTEELRLRYPKAAFSTVTNGSLLDPEKIDFLDRMGFSVAVSHDGPGYHLRGKDPLEDPKKKGHIVELIRRLAPKGRFNFNCVLTENNHSLRDIYLFLREKTGEDFLLSTEGLVSLYDLKVKHHGPTDFPAMRRIWRRLFEDLRGKLPDGTPLLAKMVTAFSDLNQFFGSLADARPAGAVGQKCGMDQGDDLSVDLDGNVTTCQNVSAAGGHGIGHLNDYDNVRLITSKHWAHHDNCRNCPVVQLCSGSCMYLTGEDRRPTCDGHFTYFLGTLAAALYTLTGEELEAVEGHRVRLEGESAVVF